MRQSIFAAVSPRSARVVVASALALVAAAGCVQSNATKRAQAAAAEKELEASTLRQSYVTVLRTGGLAGLETEATVDGSKLTYAIVTRRACATGQACSAPTDAASGAIAESIASELFARVVSEGITGLKDDYGTSPTLRDGYVYVVTVRRGDRTKTIRGDDATQPPELARIEAAVFAAIEKARGR
jgi:hypothetical protein